ncbi:MAG: hypothetical protein EPN97_11555 [Alphaproteobacteria bacterium]|nr:MAG: hypothetical protein EPN97_11555 [Alphaproteobacteria bacterium]
MQARQVAVHNADHRKAASRSDASRLRILDEIVNFIRRHHDSTVMEIELFRTDEEALAQGWASAETQSQVLLEIMRSLPVDVARRVKLVEAGTKGRE